MAAEPRPSRPGRQKSAPQGGAWQENTRSACVTGSGWRQGPGGGPPDHHCEDRAGLALRPRDPDHSQRAHPHCHMGHFLFISEISGQWRDSTGRGRAAGPSAEVTRMKPALASVTGLPSPQAAPGPSLSPRTPVPDFRASAWVCSHDEPTPRQEGHEHAHMTRIWRDMACHGPCAVHYRGRQPAGPFRQLPYSAAHRHPAHSLGYATCGRCRHPTQRSQLTGSTHHATYSHVPA